jgi:hypothetical protein
MPRLTCTNTIHRPTCRILHETHFIIRDTFRDGPAYVVAPRGRCRTAAGTIVPDGSTGGPEWGKREHAMRFRTHRAAARIRNQCFPTATIETVRTPIY